MNIEGYIKDLDPELQERARACGSLEELISLAKDAKIPVPDEALAAIAGGEDGGGGSWCGKVKCPKCGSEKIEMIAYTGSGYLLECLNCGLVFST